MQDHANPPVHAPKTSAYTAPSANSSGYCETRLNSYFASESRRAATTECAGKCGNARRHRSVNALAPGAQGTENTRQQVVHVQHARSGSGQGHAAATTRGEQATFPRIRGEIVEPRTSPATTRAGRHRARLQGTRTYATLDGDSTLGRAESNRHESATLHTSPTLLAWRRLYLAHQVCRSHARHGETASTQRQSRAHRTRGAAASGGRWVEQWAPPQGKFKASAERAKHCHTRAFGTAAQRTEVWA